jgi:peptidylprolyl isomerase
VKSLRPAAVALLLLVPALAACGSSSKPNASSDSGTSTTVAGGSTSSTAAPTESASGAKTCATTPTKPTVTVPKTPAPTTLVVKDLKPGTGATAQAGQMITVHYVGVHYTTGKQFDASWDRNQPFQFQLGAGQVIPGWDQGIAGMKVCGRRELIIPPALAYGPSGQGEIQPNETLVFVVDLLAVQ